MAKKKQPKQVKKPAPASVPENGRALSSGALYHPSSTQHVKNRTISSALFSKIYN